MEIYLNGKKISFSKETINDLLNDLLNENNIKKEGLVVLLNNEIVKEDNYNKKLENNDDIEVLSFVSGG